MKFNYSILEEQNYSSLYSSFVLICCDCPINPKINFTITHCLFGRAKPTRSNKKKVYLQCSNN